MKNNYHFNLIAEAIRFISKHYEEQPSLDDIAAHVHLSRFHFQRVFQEWAGISPKQFLQYTTIRHAKKCLLEGRNTLETAFEVGLSGNGRLHELFLKIEACTPGEFKRRGKGILIRYDSIATPFGRALIAETPVGICSLVFLEENENPEKHLLAAFPEAILKKQLGTNAQLVKQYFSNWQVPERKIVLDLKGTPFQIQVWKALLSIPSSQLLAYQDIATKIQKPGAHRAVGTAIGNNPVAYLIPCHRVIRNSGHMGSYRWKSERKIAINGYESACLIESPAQI